MRPRSPDVPIVCAAVAALAILCATPANVAAQARSLLGVTSAGAHYRIDVPDEWNGTLVLFNNGLRADNVAPAPSLGPLAALQLADGFAVAATSYRTNFYALFDSLDDLRDLVSVFGDRVGDPDGVIVTGPSMGTLVSIEAIEQGLPVPVVGALLTCGLYSAEHLTFFTDLRLAYDVECGQVAGAAIPGGVFGLPAGEGLAIDELVGRVQACAAVPDLGGGSPPPATKAQLRRRKNLLRFSTVPDAAFLLRTMLIAVYAVADTAHAADKLAGGIGYTNIGARFSPRRFDRRIERVMGDAEAIERLQEHYVPSGAVPDGTRIVALHTDRDGQNFVEGLGSYAQRVPAENLTTVIVKEKVASHCGFADGELRAAWESLADWLRDGDQPAADDVRARCRELVGRGHAEGPCRVAKRYRFGDIDERIPPR